MKVMTDEQKVAVLQAVFNGVQSEMLHVAGRHWEASGRRRKQERSLKET